MSLISQYNRNQVFEILSTRGVYHSLFWLFLLVFLTTFELITTDYTFWFVFSNQLINVFIYASLVYFNFFYLIPNYLTKNKFRTYLILLVLSVLIVTPLKVLTFYFKFSGFQEAQDGLIEDLNLYFIPTFLIAGSSTIFRNTTDWFRNVREKQELETQTMQSELRFLKSQINPHFLFNTLNNLYALTLKKSEKAPEIVIKLSEMMRYMLYECNERRVPLRKEVNYLRNYLDLERLRQGKNVDIHFSVTGSVSDQEIAPLMFIPFLENSFKHGLSNNLSEGFVNIELDVIDQHIHLYIENSKPEVLPQRDPNRKSGGIGLVNVRRRLELMYPEQYDLKILENPNTYAVSLDIDLD